MNYFIFFTLFGGFVGSMIYENLRQKHFEKFREHASKGDPCTFKLGKNKMKGTLFEFNPDYLYSFVKDEEGNIHKVFSDDIYPFFFFNYFTKK